jgi:uncharacterized membrane protein YeaQ/YmgE (transglycosylase-associated protein family)
LGFSDTRVIGSLQIDGAECIFFGRVGGLNRKFRQSGGKEDVMGFVTWILVGLIAGWLAGQVMKGGGYGVLVDIILGILGGVLGGWVFGLLGIWPGGGVYRSHRRGVCWRGDLGRD